MKEVFKVETLQLLIPVVGIIFTIGIAYNRLETMQRDLEVVDERLQKKIKLINDLDKRIDELEAYRDMELGEKAAKKVGKE
jgi:hypothetical protein